MNIFKRKMFQKGGEAKDFLASVSGPEFEYYELSPSIEQTSEGGFVYTLRNPRGEVVSEELINTALSPTGDPVEAYKVQSKNQSLEALQTAALGLATLPPAGKLAGFVGSKIGPAAVKMGQSRFSPVTMTKLPGVAQPGKKGFQALDPTKFSSYNVAAKPGVIPATAAGGAFLGLGAMKTTEEEVLQKALDDLSKTKKTETEDKKAPAPLGQNIISDEEINAVLGTDQNKIAQAMADAEREAANAAAIEQSIVDFQDRYMRDKDMNRLLRNIGISLVETGRMTGIAKGAAAAAKEKAAEQVLEAEREAEMRLAEAKAGGVDVSDVVSIDKLEGEYLENYQAAFANKTNIAQLQKVLRTLKTKGQNIFGVGNIISSNLKKIMSYVAGDPNLAGDAKTIKAALESENPREYVKTVLEIMKNREIRNLLGESGKTISNLDRQIVDQIIGQLQDTKILSQDPKAIATKIEMLVEDQLIKQKENEERAFGKARNLALLGRDVRRLQMTTPEAPEARIRFTI